MAALLQQLCSAAFNQQTFKAQLQKEVGGGWLLEGQIVGGGRTRYVMVRGIEQQKQQQQQQRLIMTINTHTGI